MFPPRFFALCALLLWCLGARAQPVEKPPHLETARFGMPAVAVGTAIYVLGGAGPSGIRADVERIETAAKTLAVSVLRPPLLPRYFHTAEANGPFIYIMGGVAVEDEGAALTTTLERFDTRDSSVQTLAPMPLALRTPASVVAEGKIYLAGGSDEDGQWTNHLLIYDIAADTWTRGAPMLENKECELLLFGNKLLAIGGFDGKNAVRGVQSYDIGTNQWSELPVLPLKTSAHHGAVVGENVILFGDYEQRGRVQKGNPLTGNWTPLENTDFTPRRHNAVVALGDNLYVIGGNIASAGSFFNDIQAFKIQDFTP